MERVARALLLALSRMLTTATRPQTAARILVADDQPDVLEALRWLLSGEGYELEFVASTDGVLERLRERLLRSAADGLELHPRHDVGPRGAGADSAASAPMIASLPIVVMTGWGSVDTAVEAMRRGARSFVQKPWEDVTLLEIVQREIDDARASKRRDARQQRELEDARLIQRGLLPTVAPKPAGPRRWLRPGSRPTASAATAST